MSRGQGPLAACAIFLDVSIAFSLHASVCLIYGAFQALQMTVIHRSRPLLVLYVRKFLCID